MAWPSATTAPSNSEPSVRAGSPRFVTRSISPSDETHTQGSGRRSQAIVVTQGAGVEIIEQSGVVRAEFRAVSRAVFVGDTVMIPGIFRGWGGVVGIAVRDPWRPKADTCLCSPRGSQSPANRPNRWKPMKLLRNLERKPPQKPPRTPPQGCNWLKMLGFQPTTSSKWRELWGNRGLVRVRGSLWSLEATLPSINSLTISTASGRLAS